MNQTNFLSMWGLTDVALPDYLTKQIDFLNSIIEKNINEEDVFLHKNLITEHEKANLLEKHSALSPVERKRFSRWVFEQTPNNKIIQNAKMSVMAIIHSLPFLVSAKDIKEMGLEPVKKLQDPSFKEECTNRLCLPFESNTNLYLGFGSEKEYKEYIQLGMQTRSLIKNLEHKHGENNTFYFFTEENVVISELGNNASADNDNFSKTVLLEKELQKNKAAKNWAALFNTAILESASDIHCDPSILETDGKVTFKIRVDGKLQNLAQHKSNASFAINHATFNEMVSYLRNKTNAGDLGQTLLKPISGDAFDYINAENSSRIELRPEFQPLGVKDNTGNELIRVVLRVWETNNKVKTLDDLNVSEDVIAFINKIVESEHGIVLAVGPTGSGKSTAMAAILHEQSKRDAGTSSIISLEDPIEQVQEDVVQIQLTDQMKLRIERGEEDELKVRKNILRSFMRQDPDRISIGEIRDSMTAEFSSDMAGSGHKTFATFHASTPAGALTRLSAKLEHSKAALVQFLTELSFILTTKLVAAPCKHCAENVDINSVEIASLTNKFNLTKAQAKRLEGGQNAIGKGCENCSNSGLQGRKAVYGIFEMTTERKLKAMDFNNSSRFLEITTNPDIDMRDKLIDFILDGSISLQSLLNKGVGND
tara:strand:- start:1076 stop:3028 length:1953 start_codon:yes stop_codon:yes gene_type:complete